MSEKHPMSTAPRDGSYILIGPDELGNDHLMRWETRKVNPLFQTKSNGIWADPNDTYTWSEDRPEGAPEYWRRSQ